MDVNIIVFIQVVVKNRIPPKPDVLLDSQQSADNEIKGLLGMKVKGKDEELKDMLGIGKPVKEDGDAYLKGIIGVKPVSDDDKLKSLLGINGASSSDHPTQNKLDNVKDLTEPNDQVHNIEVLNYF